VWRRSDSRERAVNEPLEHEKSQKHLLRYQGARFDDGKIVENREQNESDHEENQEPYRVGGLRNIAPILFALWGFSTLSFCHVLRAMLSGTAA
jgi:hypothetical protein